MLPYPMKGMVPEVLLGLQVCHPPILPGLDLVEGSL